MTVPPEAEAALQREPLMAHLATSVDDRPHVAPVWFHYADGVVEVLTGGRKLANVRRNPLVALSVQADDEGVAAWRVTMRGTATVVDEEDEIRAAMRRVYGRYPDGDPDGGEYGDNLLVRISVGSTSFEQYE